MKREFIQIEIIVPVDSIKRISPAFGGLKSWILFNDGSSFLSSRKAAEILKLLRS